MTELFDTISEWLLERALEDEDLGETVIMLAERLVDGGMSVCRIMIGRSILHPVIGFYDLIWEGKTNRVDVQTIPRAMIDTEAMKDTPFGHLLLKRKQQIRADLTREEDVAQFPLFQKLANEGITDYAAWTKSFSKQTKNLKGWPNFTNGMSVSITTTRFNGFTQDEVKGFEQLLVPLGICVRMSTERFLARELLETYLGRKTGNLVLTGQSARGDGDTIDCVIFYSDMRDSSSLSDRLSQDEYLAAINRYFDCVAGAVMDHGGEVLKFIGDGVLAIFPIVPGRRPADAMCKAALSAAREALARASRIDQPPVFGTALHVGQVIYGNVGAANRLDYTATGSAVALASRCEDLTRKLGVEVLATSQFDACCPEKGMPVGSHVIRGFEQPVELVVFGTSA